MLELETQVSVPVEEVVVEDDDVVEDVELVDVVEDVVDVV